MIRPGSRPGGPTYTPSVDLGVDLDELAAVLDRHSVRFALAFGSRVQGGATPRSDLDLGVFGREVDPFALSADLDGFLPAIDLLDLTTAPLRISGRVANQGVVVFDADPVARVRWVADTRHRAADERIRRERFDAEFLAAARRNRG